MCGLGFRCCRRGRRGGSDGGLDLDECAGRKMSELTGLQRAFINAWFGEANFNGTEAARLAGYSGGDDPEKERDVWAAHASRTLRIVKVRKEIAQRWAAHGVTSEEVIATLVKQMRASPGDFMTEHGIIDLQAVKERGRGVVKSVKVYKGSRVELQLECSQRAAELIGKTMGLFTDKHEHQVSVKLEDVLAGLPPDFGDAVREALSDAIS